MSTTSMTVDLDEVSTASEFREPDEIIVLPWGDAPGEVASAGAFGPSNIDVASDGLIVVNDEANLRVQTFDGDEWKIVARFASDDQFTPLGVAALDSGPIVVQGLPRHSGGVQAETAFLYDRDGVLLDQGRVPVLSNSYWGGGEDAWAAVGFGVPYLWVRLTDGGRLINWDDSELDGLNEAYEHRLESPKEDEPLLPLDELIDLGYTTERVDSGTSLEILGGWGWTPSDTVLPLQIKISRNGDEQVVTLQNPGSACCWEIDDSQLVSLWIEDPEWFVFDAHADGDWNSFRIVRDQFYETNVWDFARINQGHLYVLQTSAESARIEIYDISGS